MYWTLELASYLEDAPWPATKDELIDYSIRSGAPLEVVENLQELEDDGQPYESIEEIWPDYPTKDDFFFNEDEYWVVQVFLHKKGVTQTDWITPFLCVARTSCPHYGVTLPFCFLRAGRIFSEHTGSQMLRPLPSYVLCGECSAPA